MPEAVPCLTRLADDHEPCQGTLVRVDDRRWECTEGHVMWGSASALKSTPWAEMGA